LKNTSIDYYSLFTGLAILWAIVTVTVLVGYGMSEFVAPETARKWSSLLTVVSGVSFVGMLTFGILGKHFEKK